MPRLENKKAVVTGAGSGIGRAIARRFASEGARVIVLEIDEAKAQETCSLITEAGGRAEFQICDVSAQEEMVATFERIASQEPIDILVNNAGIAHIGNIENTSEEDLDRLYRINIKGVYNGMKAAIGGMVANGGGAILNLASIASKVGILDRFAYSMTKGAVLTMTLSVARDYVQKGIRCNCVCPARVHTPFVDQYLRQYYPGREQELFQQLSAYQPLGRMGRPEEIADLALFLCSDEAAFITASAYDIDGGVTLLR